MKVIFFLILFVSQAANARQCEALFKSEGYHRIGQGIEGIVYVDALSGQAKKVFEDPYLFEVSLLLHDLLSKPLREAGFQVPELSHIDRKNSTFYREYIDGLTAEKAFEESHYSLENHRFWQRAEDHYAGLFTKAIISLLNDPRLSFEIRYDRRRLPIISGYIYHEGQRYHIGIHEENMIIRENPITKRPEFYIIDYR